jgi:hypothetical protein
LHDDGAAGIDSDLKNLPLLDESRGEHYSLCATKSAAKPRAVVCGVHVLGKDIRIADNVFEGLNNLSRNWNPIFSTEDCVIWGRKLPKKTY